MKKNRIYTGIIAMMLIALASQVFSQARVQVIHNSADAAAEVVDLWLNDQMLIDNFKFRTASPFIDAPAGTDFDVTIAPADSESASEGLATFTYNLEEGETYILVANGIVVPQGYNPPRPFDIYVYDMGREMAMNPGNTDVLVFHGSTDSPVVDVVEVGVGAGTIVDNLAYADFAGYLELPTADYQIDIRDESGTVTVVSYSAPLASFGLQGQSITVVASGFLDPGANNDGAAFGLYVALPSGGELIALDPAIPTSVTETRTDEIKATIFPNPARDNMNVQFELPAATDVQVSIYDLTGAKVMSQQFSASQAGSQQRIDIANLPGGLYFVKTQAGNATYVTKLTKAN